MYFDIIIFTRGEWMLSCFDVITGYLGYSILFFVPALVCYIIFFVLLKTALSHYRSDPGQLENIRFYSVGMEIFIALFFAIGVLFTAWGLQNALVSALGGISKEEAGRWGAWGILKRLVDNGILIALWTTIVGGGGGYLMRLCKYFFLGKELSRCASWRQEQERRLLFEALGSMKSSTKR